MSVINILEKLPIPASVSNWIEFSILTAKHDVWFVAETNMLINISANEII